MRFVYGAALLVTTGVAGAEEHAASAPRGVELLYTSVKTLLHRAAEGALTMLQEK